MLNKTRVYLSIGLLFFAVVFTILVVFVPLLSRFPTVTNASVRERVPDWVALMKVTIVPSMPGAFPDSFTIVAENLILRDSIIEESLTHGGRAVCVEKLHEEARIEGFQMVAYSDDITARWSPRNCLIYSHQTQRIRSGHLGDPDSGTGGDYQPDAGTGIDIDEDKFEVVFPSESNPYYYFPYDSFDVVPLFDITLGIYDGDDKLIDDLSIEPALVVDFASSEWIASGPLAPNEVRNPTITLSRPLFSKILVPLLFIPILLAAPTIILVESLGTAVEISIALLLGTWTVREIVLPDQLPGFLVLDLITFIQFSAILISLLTAVLLHLYDKGTIFDSVMARSPSPAQYVGLPASDVVHRADCSHLEGQSLPMLQGFADIQSAVQNGRRFCKDCLADQTT